MNINQVRGKLNRELGKQFEKRIEDTLAFYRSMHLALIDKTPEPVRVLSSVDRSGIFKACFEKRAQPDYKGVIRGGVPVVLEAKFTVTDRMEQGKVLEHQAAYMDEATTYGTQCFVICGFSSGQVYLVPWVSWHNMKQVFGRKYVTEEDLKPYRVSQTRAGLLNLIERNKRHEHET